MTEVAADPVVKKITAQRAGHKSHATKLVKEAENLIKTPKPENAVRMRVICSSLAEKLETIESLDNQMIDALLDGDEIEKTVVDGCEYRLVVQEVMMGITAALDKMLISENDDRLSTRSSEKPQNAKLPKLIIEPFSGEILQFQEFWESYNSAVHENDDLDKVTKFNYLRSLLKSQASSVISGLSLTVDNYDEAISLLKSRYGNKQVLISAQ